MKKSVISLFLVLCVFSCNEKTRTLHIFIPEHYIGDVELHFGIDFAKHHMISSKDDMYVIFLSGNNLSKVEIKEKNFPGGPYDMSFYYYSKDTLYQLNSTTVRTGTIVDTSVWVNAMGASGSYGSIQYFSVTKNSK